MKNIRAAAQMVTRASGDIDYTGRNPVDTLQRVLDALRAKILALQYLLGLDLGMYKPTLMAMTTLWLNATTNCQLDPAPLQLLALCLVAPRAISDQIANDVNNKSSPSEIADAFSKFIEGAVAW
ncbi:hypothetical protein Pmar_PMAR022113 [Perkinsus marinus ATCC 50983]|uniref:Uncharacterized protein n=1 Tax=Perkinsus marinus (strain ATCC 50983 / TXsc) TaxID=423536 RepID=C5M1H8_PERM5|nr:hypothetical protein Pmar_PMAR022113 [Perkinsus marinus ATCC 50983]EEQ97164.1 hypothetical protein Pmar_PMAR022113 [Perkinsus marinus ATCC 50983]|eukprot:XP_002764447.1 hypothetical protein Pmar_PMAR022113 [Perkinsus marinus ATCC 50983]